jgi:hypothetical protein
MAGNLLKIHLPAIYLIIHGIPVNFIWRVLPFAAAVVLFYDFRADELFWKFRKV